MCLLNTKLTTKTFQKVSLFIKLFSYLLWEKICMFLKLGLAKIVEKQKCITFLYEMLEIVIQNFPLYILFKSVCLIFPKNYSSCEKFVITGYCIFKIYSKSKKVIQRYRTKIINLFCRKISYWYITSTLHILCRDLLRMRLHEIDINSTSNFCYPIM